MKEIGQQLRRWSLAGAILLALALVGCAGESAEDKAAKDKECRETFDKIALTSSPVLMEWFNENCTIDNEGHGKPVAR